MRHKGLEPGVDTRLLSEAPVFTYLVATSAAARVIAGCVETRLPDPS